MNTTVSATGMQVKAATSKNLVISNESSNGFGVTATADTSAQENMSPATSSDGKTFAYSTKAADNYNNSAVGGINTSNLTTVDDTNKTYVYKDSFWVMSESGDFANLYVNSLTVTNSGDDLAKSLRISVTYGDKTYIYAPVWDDACTGLSCGSTLTNTTVYKTKSVDNASPALGSVTSSAQEIVIRIWFEGQDANCHSANAAIQTSNYSIDINFIGSAS